MSNSGLNVWRASGSRIWEGVALLTWLRDFVAEMDWMRRPSKFLYNFSEMKLSGLSIWGLLLFFFNHFIFLRFK